MVILLRELSEELKKGKMKCYIFFFTNHRLVQQVPNAV